jgi:hypothetical protein
VTNNLVKVDDKYKYKVGPPLGGFCTAAKVGTAEGAFIKRIKIDPPLGTDTEAFFDSVFLALQANASPSSPAMSGGFSLFGDLNGDGVVDMSDFTIIRSAFGACIGSPNFIGIADYDFDGCITLNDYQIWYQFYKAANGLP